MVVEGKGIGVARPGSEMSADTANKITIFLSYKSERTTQEATIKSSNIILKKLVNLYWFYEVFYP